MYACMDPGAQSAPALRLAAALSECITQGCTSSLPEQPAGSKRSSADAAGRVILVASAESVDEIAAPLRRCFTHELSVEAPDQAARLRMLHGSLRSNSDAAGTIVSAALEHVAAQTAGMLPTDLTAIVADAAAAAAVRGVQPSSLLAASSGPYTACSDDAACGQTPELRMGAADFEQALSNLRQRTAIAIGAPQACMH